MNKLTTHQQFNVLSLFANIGVAEAYLNEIGVNVVLANELEKRRADLYNKIYPKTEMVCGDIMSQSIFDDIIIKSKKYGVNLVMATPPCQGMSTAGQQNKDDERNKLILPVIEVVKKLEPKYVFIENVPAFLSTKIMFQGSEQSISTIIQSELESLYTINSYIIDTKDFSVPQMRQRTIILLSKKSESVEWKMPKKENKIITMRDAIGDLPMLDPYISDISYEDLLKIFPHYEERKLAASKISHWHSPPHHIKRQVISMQHTPSGKTAFDNEIYYPKKKDGTPVRGYHNTYKRQNWDTPAYTVTMDNRKISSQNNVHPGRFEYIDNCGNKIFSDARVLSLYELMKITTLPDTWNIPDDVSEQFLRRILGEGIPPLFVKKVFLNLGVNNE